MNVEVSSGRKTGAYFTADEKARQMARESFLLRTDPKILDALRRWAEDELRSSNGQLDYILRKALKDAGRLPKKDESANRGSGP